VKAKILLVAAMVMFSVNAHAGRHHYQHSNYHHDHHDHYDHHDHHDHHYHHGDYGHDCHEYTNDLLTAFGVGTGVGIILGSVANSNNCNNCNNNNVRTYDPEYDGRTDCYKTVRRVWENGKMHEVVTEICNGHKVVPSY